MSAPWVCYKEDDTIQTEKRQRNATYRETLWWCSAQGVLHQRNATYRETPEDTDLYKVENQELLGWLEDVNAAGAWVFKSMAAQIRVLHYIHP